MNVFDLEGSLSLDTKEFEKAIKNAKKQGEELGKGLQEQDKQFIELQKELGRLANELSAAQDEINSLKTQLNGSAKAADSNADSTADMADEMKKAKDAMDKAADSAEDLGDEEEKTSDKTDDYSDSAEEAKEKSHRFEKALGSLGSMASDVGGKIGGLAVAIKDTLVKAAEVGVAAVGAASTAVAALTKSAVSSYGEYEQLVGGAKKIFDEMDYSIIAKDAANAFKDLNMSASQYLESINLAGANFAQSMGDEKGYNTARKGMLAIADYASGTGKNLNELNQKYQMITRAASSYQSIADQFSGILPATSADFLEQAQAAGLLSSEYDKLTDVPIAEYQQSVTEMLERGVSALGLSQNTARESTETLTGSIAMTKAAWDNLVTGLADPDADLGLLIDNFTESASASLKNIIPTIEQALGGISQLVETLAPKIASGIPAFVKRVGPPLISAALQLAKAFGNAIVNGAPQLLPYIKETITKVITAITENGPEAISAFTEFIGMINDFIMQNLPEFIAIGGQMLSAIAQGLSENLPTMIGYVAEMVAFLADQISANLPVILDAAGSILGAIGNGILDNLPILLDSAVEILTTLSGYLSDNLPELIPAAIGIITDLASELTKPERLEEILGAAFRLITSLAEGLLSEDSLNKILEEVPKVLDNIISALTSEETLSGLAEAALTIIASLVEFLKSPENWWKIFSAAQHILSSLATGLKSVGTYMDEAADTVIQSFLDSIGLGKIYEKGKEIVGELKRGIEDSAGLTSIGNAVVGSIFPFANFDGGAFSYSGSSSGYSGHRRAKGGIITQPEIALIGEAGAEAVIPLENNTQWIDNVAERLNAKGGSGVVIQNLNINMEGMKIASDYDTERFVELLSEKLQALSTSQSRAIGGVGW